jgi:hypothetical protein
MKRFMNKKVAAIGLAAGLLLGAGGAAFAYFTSTGGGTGTASTAALSTNITATSPDPAANSMGPGVAPEALTVTIKNPNANTTTSYVTSLKATIHSTGFAAGCSAGDYQLATSGGSAYTNPSAVATDGAGTQTVTVPVGLELAPGASTPETIYIGFVDLTNNANPNANQSGCASQSVTIDYVTS